MDAIRKAAERVEQSVLETVGSASKTELSPLLLEKLKMADDIKVKCEKLVHAMEKHIPSDPRLTSSFSNHSHPADAVAQAMKELADSAECWPEMAEKACAIRMFRSGQNVYKTLCRSEKSYIENSAIHFIAPMKQFLIADIKRLEQERRELMTLRVDMDSARNRAAKHEECAPEAERATHDFERQKDIVKEEIRGLERKLGLVCISVKTYVDDHVTYLETSLEAMRELQKAARGEDMKGEEKKNGEIIVESAITKAV